MRETVEVPLAGAKVQVKPHITAELLRTAFNNEDGACRHWLNGDVTGSHAASTAENRRRVRLARDISVADPWLLLVLKDACYYVPYQMPVAARQGDVVVIPGTCRGVLDRAALASGLELLYHQDQASFRGILQAQRITPALADRVIQLSLFGRMVYARPRRRSGAA